MVWFEQLLQDIRLSLRTLRKNPAFSTVAILTLALGIGSNTAIFSVVNAVLLRSLPFTRSSELVDISGRNVSFDLPYLQISFPDLYDLRSSSSFASIAAYEDQSKEFSGHGKPLRIEDIEVTEDFFSLLGIRPLYGRTFTAADMQPGNRNVVLGYPFWHERFGSDPSIIGKTITLDAEPYTVIGIIPPQQSLAFASESDVWTAFIPTGDQLAARDRNDCSVVARLRPGVNITQAQNELGTIAARLTASYPDAHNGWSLHVTSLRQIILGDAKLPLAILSCAVGFVLLIACANVTNLFLAHSWARRREFAIRSAIGATRSILIRQLIVESLLVALAGGACAFFASIWTIQAVRVVLPPEIPRTANLHIGGEVAWFAIGASLLAALLSSLAPIWMISGQDAGATIKETGAGSGGAAHNTVRRLLVIAEVGLAMVLLIGSTLALRSFGRLLHLQLGFRPDRLVTLKLELPKFRFATAELAIIFVQQFLDSTRGVTSVESASAGLVFPLSDEIAETSFQTEQSTNDPSSPGQPALMNRVAPQFFRSLGIPLLAGRDFTSSDAKGNSLVFIVNETLARKYFGTLDVVGKHISTRKQDGHPVWGEIVGVVGNVRETSPVVEAKPQVYASFYQSRDVSFVHLVVRTKSDPALVLPLIQDSILSLDKNQPVASVATLNERIAAVNAQPRSQSLLLGIFGTLGLILALVGIYGVMSYLVSTQTREIGIRLALGATPRGILCAVISRGIKLTLIGVFFGSLCGLALTRYMRSLLFGINSADPITFVAVAALLALVALAACFIPAHRASSIDPIIALREE